METRPLTFAAGAFSRGESALLPPVFGFSSQRFNPTGEWENLFGRLNPESTAAPVHGMVCPRSGGTSGHGGLPVQPSSVTSKMPAF